MASEQLKSAIDEYEKYISKNGIDENVINAYVMAAETAILAEKDVEYGLKVSARAKEIIESFVLHVTGGTIWDLDSY